MKTLLTTALLVLASGCNVQTSSSSYSSSSSLHAIGGTCEDDGDCAGSTLCGVNFPGGYCFQRCTGHPEVCPSGSFCARLSTTGAECYKTCSGSYDCRAGYECAKLDNTSTRVCLPRE